MQRGWESLKQKFKDSRGSLTSDNDVKLMKQKYGQRGVVQPENSEASPAADMESPDSRPVSLRGPESRNADNEIQVSFSHAVLGPNLNERFTEYRERMSSALTRQ